MIEDDGDLQGALRLTLERGGLDPIACESGRDGLRALHEQHPAAVVLDIGLPDLSGWEVLERIRDLSEVPVLLLTARSLESDKVRGLREGADDYLTKPFSNAELLARVEAMMRRADSGVEIPEGPAVLEDERSGLRMDLRSRRVSIGDVPVELTPLEWRLLRAFVRHRGQVLSAEQLLELVWDDRSGAGAGRVKFAVRRLRAKLGPAGDAIETVRGFGYRF